MSITGHYNIWILSDNSLLLCTEGGDAEGASSQWTLDKLVVAIICLYSTDGTCRHDQLETLA